MKLGNFIKGLEILQQYYKNPNGYHISAEHDVVYVFKTDRPVSQDDLTRLVALGWFQEGTCEDRDGDDFKSEHYDPEESWTAYV